MAVNQPAPAIDRQLQAKAAVGFGRGVLLAASPWLFGFADRVYWPHLILGLAEIGAGLMTRTTPDTRTGADLRV